MTGRTRSPLDTDAASKPAGLRAALPRFGRGAVMAFAMILCMPGWAIGVGGQVSTSSLFEPLQLVVPVELGPGDSADVEVQLALGGPTPGSPKLDGLRSRIVRDADGHFLLKIWSTAVIDEPIMHLRVELRTGELRVARELSLLFDPPVNGRMTNPVAVAEVPEAADREALLREAEQVSEWTPRAPDSTGQAVRRARESPALIAAATPEALMREAGQVAEVPSGQDGVGRAALLREAEAGLVRDPARSTPASPPRLLEPAGATFAAQRFAKTGRLPVPCSRSDSTRHHDDAGRRPGVSAKEKSRVPPVAPGSARSSGTSRRRVIVRQLNRLGPSMAQSGVVNPAVGGGRAGKGTEAVRATAARRSTSAGRSRAEAPVGDPSVRRAPEARGPTALASAGIPFEERPVGARSVPRAAVLPMGAAVVPASTAIASSLRGMNLGARPSGLLSAHDAVTWTVIDAAQWIVSTVEPYDAGLAARAAPACSVSGPVPLEGCATAESGVAGPAAPRAGDVWPSLRISTALDESVRDQRWVRRWRPANRPTPPVRTGLPDVPFDPPISLQIAPMLPKAAAMTVSGSLIPAAEAASTASPAHGTHHRQLVLSVAIARTSLREGCRSSGTVPGGVVSGRAKYLEAQGDIDRRLAGSRGE